MAMRGCAKRRSSAPQVAGRITLASDGSEAMLSCCASCSADVRMRSRPLSNSPITLRAMLASRVPLAVRCTLRVVRSNSTRPSASSRSRIALLSEGCVMNSCSAVLLKFSDSLSARNRRNWRGEIFIP